MRTPSTVLAGLLRSDPSRPRVTFYDDTPGPTQGERIELSGKVLANWVAKAGNALQEEYDVGPGSRVRLDLPAEHWRTLYWALAVWAVGAAVVTDDDGAEADVAKGGDAEGGGAEGGDTGGGGAVDLTVTADPGAEPTGELVVVTLAALARSHPDPLPAGAMDEARELSTYGDQLSAWAEPAATDPALVTPAGVTAYDAVVPEPTWPAGARVHVTGGAAQVLRTALAVWAVDGSVVLVRGADSGLLPDRLSAEGVTADLG